jgi:glycerol-3-phosphate cytidylyltransferase
MKKHKTGYTTGVYDLFHIGHLNIIKRAKEMCEYLIVGVSTDELVLNYKGQSPVISFDERFEIVSSIKFVDKVVVQSSMDKLAAWHEHKFDVIFHGDDWKNSDIYKQAEAELRKHGVEFVYFPYTQTTSSTLIAQYLRNQK